jgi:L-seryl-tRNA(Ser) seleniumtransferase
VIHRKHRCNFDHAIRSTGARLIEFGYSRDQTHGWELEDAINARTAAVAYIAALDDSTVLPLEDVVAIAHSHAVPVVVDAAVALPPSSNLRELPAIGIDLCAFSGGKAIGGPQNTGFIVGRDDLIEACALNANPNHNTVGRPFKVNAEAIVGLLVALERYVSLDPIEEHTVWRARTERVRGLAGFEGDERARIVERSHPAMPIPALHIRIGESQGDALDAAEKLRSGDPPVWVSVADDELVINPHALLDEDVAIVAERLRAVVTARARPEGIDGPV